MSKALWELGGLRFWSANEIQLREQFQDRAALVVRQTLLAMNPAWQFERCEGPCLHPESRISQEYNERDVFFTQDSRGGETLCLRPETTASSYAYMGHLLGATKAKYPLCVYQAGKSFRRELNDGASAAKLRFNEFWQLEFQCAYSVSTKADYRTALIKGIEREIGRFTRLKTRVIESDRLPAYSRSTVDIEVYVGEEPTSAWRELASCSIRTDFDPDVLVCEIAIGLDRVAELAAA